MYLLSLARYGVRQYVPWLLLSAAFTNTGFAQAQGVPGLSHYGVPGYIEMPSGFALPDGTVAVSVNGTQVGVRRGTFAFQATPRLLGTFRYSYLQDYFPNGALYDRSFDLRYLIVKEDPTGWMPAVSIGLQDIGGTGIFGAEYFAASKHFDHNITATVGIGWGRFGSYNGFQNPLAIFSDGFKNRPGFSGIEDTGRVAFDRFFRGDAAFFAAADWRPNEHLRLSAEYSSDAMRQEVRRMGYDFRTPINIGAEYRFDHGSTIGISLLSGSTVALSYSLAVNPASPRAYSGREPGPPAISSGLQAPVTAWTTDSDPEAYARLKAALQDQGVTLRGVAIRGDAAVVSIENFRWPATAQALGRTAAVLSAQLPAGVATFQIRTYVRGMAVTEAAFRRSDLKELEFAFDGAWQSYARADIRDASLSPSPPEEWRSTGDLWLFPYVTPFLFDPDDPLRADFGMAVGADWSPAKGFYLSGSVRKKLFGNLDEANRPSFSSLPHVRSDAWLYGRESDLTVPYLTAEYFWRPGENVYGKVMGGLLERMYGGVSTEFLWAPPGQRLALGLEVSYVRQRDYDGGFSFLDYDVVTGFLSTYYDFGNGFHGQIDMGRYLAQDWGATFTLTRRFNNGFEVGAFFTLTEVGFDEFGEGSFDKGIAISVPLTWMTGKPSLDRAGMTIRPILRDGGAQLALRNRLFNLTRSERQGELDSRWGQFWR